MFLIPLKRVSADNANAELMDRRAEFTELQKKKKKGFIQRVVCLGLLYYFEWVCLGVFFDWKIRLCIGDIAVP